METVGALMGLGGTGLSAGLAAREAAKNRRFQKKMYRHRYQYTVKDMKKAGINPIMAAGMGLGGGGSPSGSMASMPDFGNAARTVIDEKRMESERGKRRQEVTNLKKANELLGVQIQGARAAVGETRARTQRELANTLLILNQKDRWQPVSDLGGTVGVATSTARQVVESLFKKPWESAAPRPKARHRMGPPRKD